MKSAAFQDIEVFPLLAGAVATACTPTGQADTPAGERGATRPEPALKDGRMRDGMSLQLISTG